MRSLARSTGLDKHQDFSGTIASGGTAQAQVPQSQDRHYLFIQNLGTGDLWVNYGIVAVIGQPSVRIPQNAELVEEGNFVSGESISIIASDTGHPFTIKTSLSVGSGLQAGAP
jgi:hypothetical protein